MLEMNKVEQSAAVISLPSDEHCKKMDSETTIPLCTAPVIEITDISSHAWCPALERVVTAGEIWNLLYHDELLKEVPLFQCVEANCRTRLILRNCQPYMTPFEARFRLYSGQGHHHQCAYMHQQRKLNNQLHHRRLQMKHRPIKSQYTLYSA